MKSLTSRLFSRSGCSLVNFSLYLHDFANYVGHAFFENKAAVELFCFRMRHISKDSHIRAGLFGNCEIVGAYGHKDLRRSIIDHEPTASRALSSDLSLNHYPLIMIRWFVIYNILDLHRSIVQSNDISISIFCLCKRCNAEGQSYCYVCEISQCHSFSPACQTAANAAFPFSVQSFPFHSSSIIKIAHP